MKLGLHMGKPQLMELQTVVAISQAQAASMLLMGELDPAGQMQETSKLQELRELQQGFWKQTTQMVVLLFSQ